VREIIESLYEKKESSPDDLGIFKEFIAKLNSGEIRAAEKRGEIWQVNGWVKKGILLGFRLGEIAAFPKYGEHKFWDKSTYPEQTFSLKSKIRIVPGGSSVRDGAYLAAGVTMMPPAYVNVGAYVDAGTMVDSHALVGSCAQIGKNVHLSAAAQIGGVLEPIGANPVIIEDDVFVGGNTGVYEGVLVKKRAILASGVIITKSTPVYDATSDSFLAKEKDKAPIIPEGAVVVAGSRPLKSNPKFSVYCPIIIKYRDSKSEASVTLEEALR